MRHSPGVAADPVCLPHLGVGALRCDPLSRRSPPPPRRLRTLATSRAQGPQQPHRPQPRPRLVA
eukprot:9188111-Lingulodinium_polyedra.AAC.1